MPGGASTCARSTVKLQSEERDNALALWQRKGKRAFEAEAEAKAGTENATGQA